jgi:hypothetical protein
MVKRKWVRFGIIPIEKKFGQVLEGCIRALSDPPKLHLESRVIGNFPSRRAKQQQVTENRFAGTPLQRSVSHVSEKRTSAMWLAFYSR